MEVQNFTALQHFVFEKHGRKGEVFDVIALRGTFDLVPFAPATLSAMQQPVCMADTYWGAPETSSLRHESDLAAFKPATDIVIQGHARSFGSAPAVQWIAGLALGPLVKAVRVTGPRAWEKSLLGFWKLGVPQAATEIPLQYELAYGGYYPDPRDADQIVQYDANPAGCGFVSKERMRLNTPIAAPQIEDPHQPIKDLNSSYMPQGFGPISRLWQPRLARAGTYGAQWRTDHYPDLPPDFSNTFYNGAHPDLVWRGAAAGDAAALQTTPSAFTHLPRFVTGNEPLSLIGVFPEGRMDTALPGYRVQAEAVNHAGVHRSLSPLLDTVIIDVDTRTVSLVWRITLQRQWRVRGIALYEGHALEFAPLASEPLHSPAQFAEAA